MYYRVQNNWLIKRLEKAGHQAIRSRINAEWQLSFDVISKYYYFFFFFLYFKIFFDLKLFSLFLVFTFLCIQGLTAFGWKKRDGWRRSLSISMSYNWTRDTVLIYSPSLFLLKIWFNQRRGHSSQKWTWLTSHSLSELGWQATV